MKSPIVITSLEEDFRKIGLLKALPLSESTPPATEAAAEDVEAEDIEGELDESETEALESALEDGVDPMEEWRVKYRLQRISKHNPEAKVPKGTKVPKPRFKKIATEKTPAEKKTANARDYQSRKSEIAKKNERRRNSKKWQSYQKDVLAAAKKNKTRKQFGADSQEEATDFQNALKSFANAAIIAEHLKQAFAEWVSNDLCESVEDAEHFADRAETMAAIAETFAGVAEALAEAQELPEDVLAEMTEAFESGLEAILEAVDEYDANMDEDDAALSEDADASDDEDEMGND